MADGEIVLDQKEVFTWPQTEDLAYHQKCPLSLIFSSLADVDAVADIYFGCKICSMTVALYQGEDTFLEHIRTCHSKYYTPGLPPPDIKPRHILDGGAKELLVVQLEGEDTHDGDEDLSSALHTISQISSEQGISQEMEAAEDDGDENSQSGGSEVHVVIEGAQSDDENELETETASPSSKRRAKAQSKFRKPHDKSKMKSVKDIKEEEDEGEEGEQNDEESEEMFVGEDGEVYAIRTKSTTELPPEAEIECDPDEEHDPDLDPECDEKLDDKLQHENEVADDSKNENEDGSGDMSAVVKKKRGRKPLTEEEKKLRFSCKYCDKSCVSRAHREEHENTHMGIKTHSCPICGKMFTRLANMQAHQLIHKGERKWICDKCPRSFLMKSALTVHTMRLHTNIRRFPCEHCGRRFKDKSDMQRHVMIHTGETPFICEICGKGFRYKVDLNVHVLDHKGMNPLKCEICGKTFNHRHNLTKHYLVHTGEKNFQCQWCDRKFREKSHLNRHFRALHSSERPYECDFGCLKRFADIASLNLHRKTHTTAYKCSVCEKTFTQKQHAERHLQIHLNN